MDKKIIVFIIIGVIVSVVFGKEFPLSLTYYTSLPDEYKRFWTAIVVSGIGITIHIAKKKTQDKEMCMTGDLFEILMFMIIPAVTSFEIMQNEIKQQPVIITTVFLGVLVAWVATAYHLVHKEFFNGGNRVLSHVKRFFVIMLAYGVALTAFVMYLQSLVPKL